jgi:hypothetical protein
VSNGAEWSTRLEQCISKPNSIPLENSGGSNPVDNAPGVTEAEFASDVDTDDDDVKDAVPGIMDLSGEIADESDQVQKSNPGRDPSELVNEPFPWLPHIPVIDEKSNPDSSYDPQLPFNSRRSGVNAARFPTDLSPMKIFAELLTWKLEC